MDDRTYYKKEYSGQSVNFYYGEQPGRQERKKGISVFDNRAAKETVTQNKLLANFLPPVLRNFLSQAERVEFANKDYIYQPGETLKYIYFPETLVASEFQIIEDGRTVEISLIGNEGLIGALPFCAHRQAANWIQPIIPGTALKIELDTLAREVFATSEFITATSTYLENYIRQISQKAVCLCFHHIEARLCTWLLMLTARLEGNRFHLTHEQIARSIGVHRPSITQIAKSLRDKGIINYNRGEIEILNRRELEDAACECFQQFKEIFSNKGANY